MKPHKEWIEEENGKPYRCKMYLFEVNGRTVTGINRRPVVSEEEAKRNNEILCRILVDTLGRNKKTG